MTRSPGHGKCAVHPWPGLCGMPLALGSNEWLGITGRDVRGVASLAYPHGSRLWSLASAWLSLEIDLKLTFWTEKIVLQTVCKDDATPASQDIAEALVEFAEHVRGGGSIGSDFECSNRFRVYSAKKSRSRRTLIVAVDADLEEDKRFAPLTAAALREYATAIDDGRCGRDMSEEFTASTGCSVMALAGQNDFGDA